MKTRLMSLFAAALLMAGCATGPANKAAAIPDLSRYHSVLVESVTIASDAGMLSNPNRHTLERQLRLALVASIPAELRALAPAADVLRVQVTVTALDAVEPLGARATRVGLPQDRGTIAFDVRYFRHGAFVPFATVSEQHRAGRFVFGDSFSHYAHAVGALRDWGAVLASSMPST